MSTWEDEARTLLTQWLLERDTFRGMFKTEELKADLLGENTRILLAKPSEPEIDYLKADAMQLCVGVTKLTGGPEDAQRLAYLRKRATALVKRWKDGGHAFIVKDLSGGDHAAWIDESEPREPEIPKDVARDAAEVCRMIERRPHVFGAGTNLYLLASAVVERLEKKP